MAILLLLLCLSSITFSFDFAATQNTSVQNFGRSLDPGAFRTVFQIDDSSNENGGCAWYMTRIQTTYKEAVEMLDGAIAALQNLKRPRPANTPGTRDDYNNYVRQEQVLTALFGDAMMDSAGLTGGNKFPSGQLVLDRFEKLKKGNTEPENAGKTFYIFCGDRWIKYLKPDDEDPGRPGQKVKDRPSPVNEGLGRLKLDYSQGGWYAEAVGPPPHYMASAGKDQEIKRTSGDPFCKGFLDTVIASTDMGSHSITLCAPFLKIEPYSVKDLKGKISYLAPLDSFTGASMTMLHEWLHLFTKMNDLKVKSLFRKIECYGWESCIKLRKTEPGSAISTVETYAYFALAMYYDEWWWGTGKAMKADSYASELKRVMKKAVGSPAD